MPLKNSLVNKVGISETAENITFLENAIICVKVETWGSIISDYVCIGCKYTEFCRNQKLHKYAPVY